MLRSRLSFRGFSLDVWEQASGDHPSQDKSLVLPRGGSLRLAAIDGATPHPEAERYIGADAASAASATVALALRASETIEDGYRQANEALYESHARSALRARASVVAADISIEKGKLSAWLVRAGDCQAYVRTKEDWQALLANPEPPERSAERIARYGHLDLDGLLRAIDQERDELLVHPEEQAQPLGTLPEIKTESAAAQGALELVLASDGARLDEERVSRLEEWLGDLRRYESESPEVEPWKRHDDVTVIRVRPA